MPHSTETWQPGPSSAATDPRRRRLVVGLGLFAGANALLGAAGAGAAVSADPGPLPQAARLTLRPGKERGYFDHGWLKTYHSFSFARYRDPSHMSFGPLRVINEDRIEPGGGFPMHGHRDMEILTYVLSGALQHRDSMGNGSVIRAGEVQRMSAGTGVQHSEFNPSVHEAVHLLQVWLHPSRAGLEPSYQQTRVDAASKQGRLQLIAAESGAEGALRINQEAWIYAGSFSGAQAATHDIAPDRQVYLHVARGAIGVNQVSLQAGDAVKAAELPSLALAQGRDAEVLLFDLPSEW